MKNNDLGLIKIICKHKLLDSKYHSSYSCDTIGYKCVFDVDHDISRICHSNDKYTYVFWTDFLINRNHVILKGDLDEKENVY